MNCRRRIFFDTNLCTRCAGPEKTGATFILCGHLLKMLLNMSTKLFNRRISHSQRLVLLPLF